MAVVTLIVSLMVANLPLWVYAYLYRHLPNLLAGGLYFALLIASAKAGERILARFDGPPGEVLGGLAVLVLIPGVFLGVFCVAPFLQLALTQPALQISLTEVDRHRDAEFFSFQGPVRVVGSARYWHTEKRHKRTGESTTTWTEHYQVVPVVSGEGEAPVVFLTSDQGEEPAFPAGDDTRQKLHGARLIKPDGGFTKAVNKACEEAGLRAPESPILLRETAEYGVMKGRAREHLVRWLGLYNGVLVALFALIWVPAARKRRGENA